MVCFFRKDRIFLPSPMVARNLSGSKSRLLLLLAAIPASSPYNFNTRELIIICPSVAGWLRAPVTRFCPALSNFAQYCKGGSTKLLRAQKSSFPPRHPTAYLPFLRRPFGGRSTVKAGEQCAYFVRNWACSDRSI